jgi:hypothetical protein
MSDWKQMELASEALPVHVGIVHEQFAAASTDGIECTHYEIIGLNDPGVLCQPLCINSAMESSVYFCLLIITTLL